MTEFDRWRVARQEADQLLQQLRVGPHGAPERRQPQPTRWQEAAQGLGLARPAAAMRAAALRLLRHGVR